MTRHAGTVYEAPRPVEPLLSTQEAARILGVSLRTVLRLLDDRELARVRIGRRVLVDPQSIRIYLERQREGPP
jgi:excisionase family DNA binding protein